MTAEATRAAITTEIERAKAAWSAYTLLVDYENLEDINLAQQVQPYVSVDIVFLDGAQLDLGSNPLVADYGSIIIAAGAKEGTGTAPLLKLLDHFRPYLQLRDNLGSNVRTQAGKIQKGQSRLGFYYLPMTIPFWVQNVAPAVP